MSPLCDEVLGASRRSANVNLPLKRPISDFMDVAWAYCMFRNGQGQGCKVPYLHCGPVSRCPRITNKLKIRRLMWDSGLLYRF